MKRVFTEEHRRKLSLAGMGRKPEHTPEFKEKMHRVMLGNKNGHGNLGNHIQTNDALKVWRENGGIPWNKGVKGYHIHSEQWKKKMAERRRGKPSGALGRVAWNRGKHAYWCAGEKSHSWKGGVSKTNTSQRLQFMRSLEYVGWRRSVLERDDYTCQVCGMRGGRLRANHIKRFSDYPELSLEPLNGITICEKCDWKLVMNHEPEWESYFNFNLVTRGFIGDDLIRLFIREGVDS